MYSLTPTVRESIGALAVLAFCLCLMWGVAAMYQAGYTDGYQDAKVAHHG